MRMSDWSSDVCSSDLWIERGPDHARYAEGIEDMDRAEACAIVGGDTRVLALGVDADDRAGIVEQVGDDGAYALAGARRRDRQQMGGAGIAQRLARFAVAADQQAAALLGEGARLALGGAAGRAVGTVAGRDTTGQERRGEAGVQGDKEEDEERA